MTDSTTQTTGTGNEGGGKQLTERQLQKRAARVLSKDCGYKAAGRAVYNGEATRSDHDELVAAVKDPAVPKGIIIHRVRPLLDRLEASLLDQSALGDMVAELARALELAAKPGKGPAAHQAQAALNRAREARRRLAGEHMKAIERLLLREKTPESLTALAEGDAAVADLLAEAKEADRGKVAAHAVNGVLDLARGRVEAALESLAGGTDEPKGQGKKGHKGGQPKSGVNPAPGVAASPGKGVGGKKRKS